MSIHDFHLHFEGKAQNFDIEFQEQEIASSETVLVNGRNYSLQGESSNIAWLRQKISSLSSSENITLEDLQSRLREIESTDLALIGKIESFSKEQFPPVKLDIKAATEAYLSATDNPLDAHVAVGILWPGGSISNVRFGKNEDYGAHRIGSVTKTFTAFLALKLVNDDMITLETKCGDLIDESILQRIFAEPEKAKQMTLEQLLSHTTGLELSDRERIGPDKEDPNVRVSTLHERFLYQSTLNDKYEHETLTGGKTASYSNIGYDVAGWMLEIAYNRKKGHEIPTIPFSQIIHDELFTKVFHLSDDTRISPGATGDGDVIQAPCGDMITSISDLLEVAKVLQQGEEELSTYFGKGWQQQMLSARGTDGTMAYGLGCEGNAGWIQFNGLNYEIFEDGIGRDVTAHVAFPLHEKQPGIVAMCDSNALGPMENQLPFRHELRKLAGIPYS